MPDDVEALLAALGENQRIGAIGPTDLGSALDHARRFVDAIPSSARTLIDLGSGGGLPGLVIAWDRPDLRVTLVDRREKRTDALRRSVLRLEMGDRVAVITDDVERLLGDADHARRYDVVTARSFGPPATTLTVALGASRRGGLVLISDPPDSTRWIDVMSGPLIDASTWMGSDQGISRFRAH